MYRLRSDSLRLSLTLFGQMSSLPHLLGREARCPCSALLSALRELWEGFKEGKFKYVVSIRGLLLAALKKKKKRLSGLEFLLIIRYNFGRVLDTLSGFPCVSGC